jgi:hypothetical protein
MDEMIDITVEKVLNGLSGYSYPDRAYMLNEIAGRLREYADECLLLEYGLKDENRE